MKLNSMSRLDSGITSSNLIYTTSLFTQIFLIDLSLQSENATWTSLTKLECEEFGGLLVGEACGFVPDITLMSFILFFGTYTCSMALKKFKTSRFFPTTVSDNPYVNNISALIW